MTFSDTVARQREQQEKTLKRFVTYSLAGSFALHGVGLCLKVNNHWNPEQTEPEEIAIVVTEPSEEELAEVVQPEEPFSESEGGASRGSGDLEAAAFLEPPSAQTAVSEPPAQYEPVAEEDPEPTPVPWVEDVEETVTDEAVEEELTESPLVESAEDAEVTPESQNLSSLLGELRRAREQAAANRNGTSTDRFAGDNLLGEGDRNSTTAVGPAGSGSGRGRGTEEEPGSGEGNGVGEGSRSGQGSRSREITCRGCDFDYPESADGAEGTAQVIVETDDRGRVVSVMLSRSSGNAALDRAALEQARRRVRLNNARAGESYPIDVDFVQPNSAAAERVRERGDRRSITVSEPAPETVEAPATPEAPENASSDPQSTPDMTPLPPTSLEADSPSPEPSETSEPSDRVILEPQPAAIPQPTPSPELKPTTVPAPEPPSRVEIAPPPLADPPSAAPAQLEPTDSSPPVDP